MEPSQCWVECILLPYLITLCFRVKWDAKMRLQSTSESHVLKTAFCFPLPSSPGLLHLYSWPSGAVQLCMCRAVGWIKEKWCATLQVRRRLGRYRIYSHSVRETQLCQILVLWWASGPMPNLRSEDIQNRCHTSGRNKYYMSVLYMWSLWCDSFYPLGTERNFDVMCCFIC